MKLCLETNEKGAIMGRGQRLSFRRRCCGKIKGNMTVREGENRKLSAFLFRVERTKHEKPTKKQTFRLLDDDWWLWSEAIRHEKLIFMRFLIRFSSKKKLNKSEEHMEPFSLSSSARCARNKNVEKFIENYLRKRKNKIWRAKRSEEKWNNKTDFRAIKRENYAKKQFLVWSILLNGKAISINDVERACVIAP